MQLGALSNYLQNQPLGTGATSESAATGGVSDDQQPLETGAYNLSQRAILVNAVASEFDVQQLETDDVGKLQLKLQQYGLLQGNDLGGFALLHNARGQLQTDENLDAVQLLNLAKQRFDADQVGYSERVQISRMHTLVENLASARSLIQPKSA
ncbi:MAG: hypothetical protein MK185_12135 [Saccharospirillaceae bacterium]|nr:hypothetical protein A3759_14195 [Thalassolituus sp. HI0120]KZZ42753.1 hypothetical protein A3759_22245 [Thalassolituus sp. HI0120]MCH2041374.1 hypothetical protein [Saccharospirillaceae bacterium]